MHALVGHEIRAPFPTQTFPAWGKRGPCLDPGRLLSGGGEGTSLCTKNGPIRFSHLQISSLLTMVALVWGGGEGVWGEPPPLVFDYSKDALLEAHCRLLYFGLGSLAHVFPPLLRVLGPKAPSHVLRCRLPISTQYGRGGVIGHWGGGGG